MLTSWFHSMHIVTLLLGEVCAVHMTPLGKYKLHTWSLMDSALNAFSTADFNLYSFTIINCNCEYNSFVELGVLPSKLLNLRLDLGTPWT